jgi:hypothetical protein
MIMSMSRCILLDHAHIGAKHIPSFIDSFAYYYMIMSTSRCILLDHGHIGDQHIPSFIDSIRLVLHDHDHVTLHTTRSCPHWSSTHPFLRRFILLFLYDHEHITLHITRSWPN